MNKKAIYKNVIPMKVISLLVLITFTVFTFSCYSVKQGKVETVMPSKKSKIVALKTTSGELIRFARKKNTRIVENKIIGTDIDQNPVSIPLTDVEWIRVKKYNEGKTILAYVGVAATLGLAALVISWVKVIKDL